MDDAKRTWGLWQGLWHGYEVYGGGDDTKAHRTSSGVCRTARESGSGGAMAADQQGRPARLPALERALKMSFLEASGQLRIAVRSSRRGAGGTKGSAGRRFVAARPAIGRRVPLHEGPPPFHRPMAAWPTSAVVSSFALMAPAGRWTHTGWDIPEGQVHRQAPRAPCPVLSAGYSELPSCLGKLRGLGQRPSDMARGST